MKLKARCPHCEMSQMYSFRPGETPTEVQCRMDWCRKNFVPTKSNQGTMHGPKEDDIEALKTATAKNIDINQGPT